jgi:hypothetical protein
MAAQGAGLMTDYLLRTVIETWWEKVLRQLLLLEQYYETDAVVLAICANKAQLFPRYGISRIHDELLMKHVNLRVNVGMGSSNPQQRMQNFLMATNAAVAIINQAPPGANVREMVKEIYSNAGYRDGSRFWSEQQDPRLLRAMQLIQQLQTAVKGKQMDHAHDARVEQMRLQSTEKIKGAEIQVNKYRIDGDLYIRESEVAIERAKLGLEQLAQEAERQGASQELIARMTELSAGIRQAQLKLEDQRLKNQGTAMKLAHEAQMMRKEESVTVQ